MMLFLTKLNYHNNHRTLFLSYQTFVLKFQKQAYSSSSSSSSPPPQLVKVHQHDGLRTITMNDPRTRNALSLQMMKDMISAFNNDESNDISLRSIVLRSSGNVFSSGHNLKELTSENGVAAQKHVFATCTDLMMCIKYSPVPVFAAVDGLAAAAGCQVVAACDFAICTERSSFSTPGATFGLFCSTPSIPLSRKVHTSLASFMVLTGDAISASEALSSGLVVKVVKDADEMDTLIQRLHTLVKSKSRSVLQLGKRFYYEQLEKPYEAALRDGENVMVRNLQMRDGREGLDSFRNKRMAVWLHTNEEEHV